MREAKTRSIVKAISYRCIGTVGTMAIAFFFTGELWISAGIGIADLTAGSVLYYTHERIWNIVGWGKK